MRVTTYVLATELALAAVTSRATYAAGEETVPKLTLTQAIRQAEARSPQVLAAGERVAAREHELDGVRGQRRPVVNAFAMIVAATVNNTTATTLGGPGVDVPRVGSTRVISADPSFRPYATTMVAVGVRQLLSDFGRTTAQVGAAEARVEVDAARRAEALDELRAQVTDAFFAVLVARSAERITSQALDRARARRESVVAGVNAGTMPAIAVTQVDADIARYEVIRLRAAGTLHQARVILSTLVVADAREVDADDLDPPRGDLPSETRLLASAEARHPWVLGARAMARARGLQAEADGKLGYPTLFATAGVTGRGAGASPSSGKPMSGDGLVPWMPNYHLGIGLAVPLFDAPSAARAEASRAEARAASHAEAEARARLRSVVVRARAQAELVDAEEAALVASRDAARRNFDQADARFKSGLGSSLELADAEAKRVSAELELVIGTLERARARATLDRLAGEPVSGAR